MLFNAFVRSTLYVLPIPAASGRGGLSAPKWVRLHYDAGASYVILESNGSQQKPPSLSLFGGGRHH